MAKSSVRIVWFIMSPGLSLVVCCALALWLCRRGRRRTLTAPPAYPGALPLIGNAHQFIGDELQMWNVVKDISNYSLKEGGVISMHIGVYTAYVITDLDDYFTVANTCLDKPYVYSFGKEWLGNGLITADEKTWKLHRKLLNPMFNQKMLNMLVDVFNDQSRRLVDQLRDVVGRGFFDPEPYLFQNILETTCQSVLNMKTEENNTYRMDYTRASNQILDIILARLQQIWLHPPFLYNLSSLKRKYDKNSKIVADVSSAIIQKRKLELHEMGGVNNVEVTDNCKSLLDLLLHLAAERGVLTDSDIMDHLNTFIVASYDTTGSTMLFTLMLLGSHQDVQERVYKELQGVLGDTEENVDRHVLTKFVYLEAVLKESIRLYPIVPLVARKTQKDVKLKNYTMPVGVISLLSIYGAHRHSVWGADAEQFRPERWLEPGGVPDNPNAFAGFSLGRRNCIGKSFALMSMKTTVVHLLRRYRINADASKLNMKANPVLKPVSGHHISLELRMSSKISGNK